MKDSGIQWVGKIPDNWKVGKVKNLFKERKNKNKGLVEKNLLSLSYGNIVRKNINTTFGLLPESFETYNRIEDGDIVFRLTDLQNDKKSLRTGLCTEKGIITSAYTVLIPPENTNPAYLHYLFHSFDICKVFYNLGDGVRQGMNYDDLGKLSILLPPRDQQKKIADFLDSKCSELQSAIDNTKQTIEEYKKLKQAVITKAVTKGLEPNRKMKDSGIEWIGEIPDDWEVRRFGRTLNERSEKNNPIKSKERLSCSIDIGVTLYSEKTTNLDRFKDDFTQYKIAHVGDLVMNSMNVIVGSEGISAYYGCVSPAYYTYYDEVEGHYTARFCDYILKTKGMKRLLFSLGKGIYAIERGDDRVNTCRLKVPREDLKAIKIPLPELNEQKKIVEYLDNYSKQIDTLISQKEQFITELEKYKQSLIYEYVTGKRVLN